MNTEKKVIPFGKAVRVGNYKVWRSTINLGGRNAGFSVQQINVSNLDGSWQVKIPETQKMFATITMCYQDNKEDFLEVMFANMLTVCLNNNEYLHDGFNILNQLIITPYLMLPESEMIEYLREGCKFEEGYDSEEKVNKLITAMCDNRKELFDLIVTKVRNCVRDYHALLVEAKRKFEEEKEMKNEEIAEEAKKVLEDEKKAES